MQKAKKIVKYFRNHKVIYAILKDHQKAKLNQHVALQLPVSDTGVLLIVLYLRILFNLNNFLILLPIVV